MTDTKLHQLTVWASQKTPIETAKGTVRWLRYCEDTVERLRQHGRQAELYYNKTGEVCVYVDEIAQTGL